MARASTAEAGAAMGPASRGPAPNLVGAAAAPASAAAVWYRQPEICAHIASQFYDPCDLRAFDRALGGRVDGLWGAFGGSRLRPLLAPEIARQRRQQGHRRALATDAAYDLQIRELCLAGLKEADLVAMADVRVRELHRRLASESWQQLPLFGQIEAEGLRRQDIAFGRLRRQWDELLRACDADGTPNAPHLQLSALAAGRTALVDEHERSWRSACAWLGPAPLDHRLRRVGWRCLGGLREVCPNERVEDSPGAPPSTSARARLGACLDALDAWAGARGLCCPMVPPTLDAWSLAGGGGLGYQPGYQRRGGGPPRFAEGLRRELAWPDTA